MDVVTVVRAALRRWYVLLPALILTSLVMYRLYATAEPLHTATGQVLLVSPNSVFEHFDVSGSGEDGEEPLEITRQVNPYLGFNSSLMVTSKVVGGILDAPDTRREYQQDGLIADYAVEIDTQAPIVMLSVEGAPDAPVLKTLRRLVEDAEQSLLELQNEADAPDGELIRQKVIALPSEPESSSGKLMRLLLLVAGLGGAAALGGAVLFDAMASRRTYNDAFSQPADQSERDRAVDPRVGQVVQSRRDSSPLSDISSLQQQRERSRFRGYGRGNARGGVDAGTRRSGISSTSRNSDLQS